MFHPVPLVTAVVAALLSLAFGLRCAPLAYSVPPDEFPYADVVFGSLPNLSSTVSWLLPTLGVLHACFTLTVFFLHEHRVTLLRRYLLIFAVAVFFQEGQTLCTTLPDPNPNYSQRSTAIFLYDLYPMQFVLTSLMVNFYFSDLLVCVASYSATALGLLAVIATRFMYSVDVACAICPPVMVFLLFHWYCRSDASIMKRDLVYWFERDVLYIKNRQSLAASGANEMQRVRGSGSSSSPLAPVAPPQTFPSMDPNNLERPGNGDEAPSAAVLFPSSAPLPLTQDTPPSLATDSLADLSFSVPVPPPPRWAVNEYDFIPRSWDRFCVPIVDGEPRMYFRGIWAATDGRGPSDASIRASATIMKRSEASAEDSGSGGGVVSGSKDSGMSEEQPIELTDTARKAARRALAEIRYDPALVLLANLMSRAAAMSESERVWKPRTVCAICVGIGVAVGCCNIFFIQVADSRRPLDVPLPYDVLHSRFPKLPDHAADFFVYPIVLGTLIFTLKSRFTWTIFTRIGLLYAGSMFFRMFTMIVTAIPDPSPTCVAREHPKGTTCGDLVYSGHTVGFLMCAFTVRYFTKENRWGAAAWLLTTGGLVSVVLSRLHYTKDVITSLYVITTVNHLARVLLFKRVSLIQHSATAWLLECGYYVVRAEEELGRRATSEVPQRSDIKRLTYRHGRTESDMVPFGGVVSTGGSPTNNAAVVAVVDGPSDERSS